MQTDNTMANTSLKDQISLYPKEGGAIVFVNDTGEYLQVNEIGRIILDGLMHGKTVEDCMNAIAEEYQTDRQIIVRDTERFLADIGKHVRL
ncbi:asparagine synthase [Bifidobacterium sp. DSM 109958]|nr:MULTISPECIES: PqqD family protein [Bifidobacterium]KAA8817778.1 PqqD family protein [Bifidobacterium callitrichos]KAA8820158.1 PqqD family protein [Bifidobacterium vespertilionis]KAA8823916.1 PqqD family protein [Bifidobacterium vespertilionis]KAA8824032.1 PqqD family protein [Bifidobacterium reuteri]KAA8828954.1 PqqD family protein [Bifidobacterium myosotis]